MNQLFLKMRTEVIRNYIFQSQIRRRYKYDHSNFQSKEISERESIWQWRFLRFDGGGRIFANIFLSHNYSSCVIGKSWKSFSKRFTFFLAEVHRTCNRIGEKEGNHAFHTFFWIWQHFLNVYLNSNYKLWLNGENETRISKQIYSIELLLYNTNVFGRQQQKFLIPLSCRPKAPHLPIF